MRNLRRLFSIIRRKRGGGNPAALFSIVWVEAALITLCALAIRLRHIAPYPSGWDAIDFGLALSRYDLTAMQPHFPGYPLFVWLGRLAHRAIADPFRALSTVSAVAGGLTVGAAFLIGHELAIDRSAQVARRAGWLTAIWVGLSPLTWLVSEQPLSDSAGLLCSLLFSLAALAYHRKGGAVRSAFAGLLLGLTLGVRLSYFPLGLTLLLLLLMRFRWRTLMAATGGGLVGVLPWLLWQLSYDGVARFLHLALSFTEGHLSDWGGAVGAAYAAADRGRLILWNGLLGLGLGGSAAQSLPVWGPLLGVAPLILLVAGLILAWHRLDLHFLGAWVFPYFAWAYLGQNPENPRHLLPLIPPIAAAASAGLVALRPSLRWAAIGALLLAVTVASLPLVMEQQRTIAPMLQLAFYLRDEHQAPIFAWEEERALRYYAPEMIVYRLRHPAHFTQALLASPTPPQRVLATSAFLNGLGPTGAELRVHFHPVATFRGNPLIYPTYHTITLYEAGPTLYTDLMAPP